MSLVSYAAKLAIKPKGPVEEAIFEHIWQQTPIETVLAPLMQSEVFLYAQKSGGPDPKPLVMQGRDGKPAMLVFTSRDRAASVAKQLPPGSAEPLTQPFKEVLRWAPVELGMAINSGSALGAECTPAQMDALRKQAGIFRP
jgi:hypothetical protein